MKLLFTSYFGCIDFQFGKVPIKLKKKKIIRSACLEAEIEIFLSKNYTFEN